MKSVSEIITNDNVRDDFEKLRLNLEDHYYETRADRKFGFDDNDVDLLNSFFAKNESYFKTRIQLIVIPEDLQNGTSQDALCKLLINNVSCGDRLFFDLTHSYRIMPLMTTGVLLYLQTVYQVSVERIFYGDIFENTKYSVIKKFSEIKIRLSQLKNNKLYETYKELKDRIFSILNDIEPQLADSYVYDMRNFSELLLDSQNIACYKNTNNLSFLLPLFKREFAKSENGEEIVRKLCDGIAYFNLSMIQKASEELGDLFNCTSTEYSDPILDTLGDSLNNALSWRTEPVMYRKLAKIAKNFAQNHFFIQASLYAYEALERVADEILVMFKNSLKEHSSDPDFLELNEDLKKYKSNQMSKLNQNTKLNDTDKSKLNYSILYYVFGKKWDSINKLRNNYEHSDNYKKYDSNVLSLNDLKSKLKKDLIPTMEYLINEYEIGFSKHFIK